MDVSAIQVPVTAFQLMGNSAGAILVCVVLLWMLSVRIRDASIVDLFWGPGFAMVAWVSFLSQPDPASRSMLLPILATLWGGRLGIYLARRNLGKGEDYRYQTMRRQQGPLFWLKSLLTVFGIQGLLMWVISMPLQLAQRSAGEDSSLASVLVALGIVLFAIGLTFEAVGDAQLAAFKADPSNRGKVIDKGLWYYTRHPNYFGDALLWWGLFTIAIGQGAPLWTFISPLVMTGLLLKVSGVALLEQTITERRPAYRAYQERTSAFIPWFPRG